MLKKIISGGQSGADQAGICVGLSFQLETGGWAPKGWKTLDGPKPGLAKFGLKEHTSDSYVPRTYANVRDSDGTVRIAGNLQSRGEICTLNAINQFNKPHFDVDLNNPPPTADMVKWIIDNKIEVLNVAGNAEQTYKGTFRCAVLYLSQVLKELGHGSVGNTVKQPPTTT